MKIRNMLSVMAAFCSLTSCAVTGPGLWVDVGPQYPPLPEDHPVDFYVDRHTDLKNWNSETLFKSYDHKARLSSEMPKGSKVIGEVSAQTFFGVEADVTGPLAKVARMKGAHALRLVNAELLPVGNTTSLAYGFEGIRYPENPRQVKARIPDSTGD
jgi:hypothetical protein